MTSIGIVTVTVSPSTSTSCVRSISGEILFISDLKNKESLESILSTKLDISTPFARHDTWHIACGSGNSSGTTGIYSMNFGSPAFTISSGNADADGYGNFEYAVPSGYYALCTKNLAEYG